MGSVIPKKLLLIGIHVALLIGIHVAIVLHRDEVLIREGPARRGTEPEMVLAETGDANSVDTRKPAGWALFVLSACAALVLGLT